MSSGIWAGERGNIETALDNRAALEDWQGSSVQAVDLEEEVLSVELQEIRQIVEKVGIDEETKIFAIAHLVGSDLYCDRDSEKAYNEARQTEK